MPSAELRREDVTFASGGERCAAWLYRPAVAAEAGGETPCVVMAHGFSLVREGRLDAYAERFAAAGLAVLVFDYRHFGASGGLPRQLLDIDRQHEDWRAAIALVRGLEGIDPERIALWGTSFSGGHVAAIAAGDDRLAAVISQVPFSGLGGREGSPDYGHLARLLGAALRDELAARLGRQPSYIKVVAEEDEFAAFNAPRAAATVRALLPNDSTWENRMAPRIILRMPGYKPFSRAAEIRCPWLVCLAEQDAITPSGLAAERASAAPVLELRRYPMQHFQSYVGEWFERTVADQVAFLSRHLNGRRESP